MKWLVVSILVGAFGGCDQPKQSSDHIQRVQQENTVRQAVQAVGMPSITNFAEKRLLKQILELRDKETPTYTYIVDMQSHLHLLCNSIGYGIPYATQYTNPQKIDCAYDHPGCQVTPQADPNGLFSPAAAEGTFVACLNPETKKLSPMYVEPRIVVSLFKLN